MPRPAGLSGRRRLAGALLACVLLPGLTALLAQLRGSLTLPSDMLVVLLGVVVVALVGGWLPALAAAIVGSLLINYYFTNPHYTLKISDRNDALAVAVFTVVAAAMSSLVDLAATRGTQADRAEHQADILATADRTRTALLAAVSHDLRTPLASAKAAVAGLRSGDVEWSPDERDELLETADESLDRLSRLVDDLLDMSRLQAGALSLFPRSSGLDEIVAMALDDIGPASRDITVEIPETLPAVKADPAILERVVVNLTENALRYSPAGKAPMITASALGDRVELRVVDRGTGISDDDKERVFVPFQRLGDTDNTTGVGLGLALSRGLTEAMGGTLTAEDTPGGGLTMTVSLPAAPGD
jgi:two-component system sensor histidine kinase KdpD